MMNTTCQLLGWSGIHLELGEARDGEWQWHRIDLSWQPGDIYNCSYSGTLKWIGITAEDRSAGQSVLGIYDCRAQSTQFLMRTDDLLHHSLNRDGTSVCLTVRSQAALAADLQLFDVKEQKSKVLIQGRVHPRTTPAWLADHTQVVYEATNERLEVLDIKRNRCETLIQGQAPAVRPDGQVIAFQRDNELFAWDCTRRVVEPLLPSSALGGAALSNGLSWSPDGLYLTFGVVSGLVGKENTFYLLEVAHGTFYRLEARYFRGLLIVNS